MASMRKPLRVSVLIAFFLTAFFVPQNTVNAFQADSADAFIDSIGVNVHLYYDDWWCYPNWAACRDLLVESGIRHYRDHALLPDESWQGSIVIPRHVELGQAGLKGSFIVHPTNHDQESLESYPGLVGSAFGYFEGPNELNYQAGWIEALQNIMPQVKAAAQATGFQVIAPSFGLVAPGFSPADLGNISHTFDYGNLHNYVGGRNPGTPGYGITDPTYPSYVWQFNTFSPYWSGKPAFSTEVGYYDDPATGPDWIPREIMARYMPRLFFEQWRHGILKTYIYQFHDDPTNVNAYGLVENDGTPKPAYYSVKHLIDLLADPGPAFTPGNLNYTISGLGANARHMLLQKRDGSFWLAVWLESLSYNVVNHTPITVPSETATITFAGPVPVSLTSHLFEDNGTITLDTVTPSGSIQLPVYDKLTLLKVVPGSPPPSGGGGGGGGGSSRAGGGGSVVNQVVLTSGDEEAQVQLMLQLISILQQIIAATIARQQGIAPASASLSITLPASQRLIGPFGPGISGPQVSLLQQTLIKEGVYPEATVSGFYGPLTEAAVRRFQAKYGIEQTGIAGPVTRERLNMLHFGQ